MRGSDHLGMRKRRRRRCNSLGKARRLFIEPLEDRRMLSGAQQVTQLHSGGSSDPANFTLYNNELRKANGTQLFFGAVRQCHQVLLLRARKSNCPMAEGSVSAAGGKLRDYALRRRPRKMPAVPSPG